MSMMMIFLGEGLRDTFTFCCGCNTIPSVLLRGARWLMVWMVVSMYQHTRCNEAMITLL